jgi:hypothetical protein
MRLNQLGLGLEIDYRNDVVATTTRPRRRKPRRTVGSGGQQPVGADDQEMVRCMGEGARLHVGGALGKARAAQAKIRGGLDQALLGGGGGALGWATPFKHRCCWGSARGRDELRCQLLLKRSSGTGQHMTSPRRLHAMAAVAMREEERRGTGQRRGTRKRRVRNEWRNLILIERKLLSVMTSNGARHPPFSYAGITMA